MECREEASRARLMAEESVAHAENLASILFEASSALDKRLNDQLDVVHGSLQAFEVRLDALNQRWLGNVASFSPRRSRSAEPTSNTFGKYGSEASHRIQASLLKSK